MQEFKVNEAYCRMVKATKTNSLTDALDFLNQFMVAGLEYADAESRVLHHFKGVSQTDLSAAWAKA